MVLRVAVLLLVVVVVAVPLNVTPAPLTKPVPFTVSVNAAPPAVPLVGEIEVMTGGGLVTGKVMVVDVPPPGVGFVTKRGKFPSAEISAAVTGMVSEVALTNVVVRVVPLNVTTDE